MMKNHSIRVFAIAVSMPPMKNYTYVVASEKSASCAIIDPAWEIDKIEEVVKKHGLEVSGILLTHSHYDHVNLAEQLALKYSCNVWMAEAEITTYEFSCYQLRSFVANEILFFNDIEIVSIPTPGHTRGSTCFRIGSYVFTGDTLFIEGCGFCTGYGANPYEMYNSLHLLKAVIPLEAIIYPGHRYGEPPGQNFDYVLANNIYLHFSDVENFTKFRMREGQKSFLQFK